MESIKKFLRVFFFAKSNYGGEGTVARNGWWSRDARGSGGGGGGGWKPDGMRRRGPWCTLGGYGYRHREGRGWLSGYQLIRNTPACHPWPCTLFARRRWWLKCNLPFPLPPLHGKRSPAGSSFPTRRVRTQHRMPKSVWSPVVNLLNNVYAHLGLPCTCNMSIRLFLTCTRVVFNTRIRKSCRQFIDCKML